jgi:signal transduction histidine kinase
MASIGTLTAGLGHDMGNLLLPLDVRLELLLRAELPPELQEHVLGIQKSARYLQRLSKGLRLLATDPTAAPADRMTELGTWWADVAMLLKDALPRSVELEHILPAAECWVAIGRTGLTQAVFNLVQNAGDVLRERGVGRVLIAARELADKWVAIGVSDDGPGMSEEVRRRCLEPYFSTKPAAVSTGMGLPFVHNLVKRAGGRIEIASTAGEGTSITLVLPKARLPEKSEKTPPALAV